MGKVVQISTYRRFAKNLFKGDSMAKIQKNIEVSKETNELGNLLTKLVIEGRKALSDGWKTGEDLPAVLLAIMPDLLSALDGVDKMDDELKEDPAAFIMALVLPGAAIYKEFKKEVVSTPEIEA